MRHGPDTRISLACEKQVIKLLFLFFTSESISKSFQAMLLQARVDQGGGTPLEPRCRQVVPLRAQLRQSDCNRSRAERRSEDLNAACGTTGCVRSGAWGTGLLLASPMFSGDICSPHSAGKAAHDSLLQSLLPCMVPHFSLYFLFSPILLQDDPSFSHSL
jgi:hypothetical protein